MLNTQDLRDLATQGHGSAGVWLFKAADEIDALRAELAAARGIIAQARHLSNTPYSESWRFDAVLTKLAEIDRPSPPEATA